jgi:hypothetical protein
MSFYRVLFVGFFLALLSCAPAIKQFFPGNYYQEDHTYQNKSLGFALTYRGNWEIATDPNETRKNKAYSKELHKIGAELLFTGFTVEKTQGTRSIVAHLNETSREYAEEIRNINKNGLNSDSGCTDVTINGKNFSTWRYKDKENDFCFIEYFFTVDTYNVRVAFWTTPILFEKFLPVYDEIMGSLLFLGR